MTLIETEMSNTDALSKLAPEKLLETLLSYKHRYDTLVEEFDELKTSSNEMEQMLDKELEEEKKSRKLIERERNALKQELEKMSARFESDRRDRNAIEESLRNELSSLRHDYEHARERVRVLEQQNDDLERKDRNAEQQRCDLTRDLELTLERCAFLESELADHQQQAEMSYRLKEEMRGVRPRMAVEPLRVDRLESGAYATAAGSSSQMSLGDDHHMDCEEGPSKEPIEEAMKDIHLEEDHEALNACCSSSSDMVTPKRVTLSSPTKGGFTQSVHRIVKDLLVRVDRVENILTSLKSRPPAGPHQHLTGRN